MLNTQSVVHTLEEGERTLEEGERTDCIVRVAILAPPKEAVENGVGGEQSQDADGVVSGADCIAVEPEFVAKEGSEQRGVERWVEIRTGGGGPVMGMVYIRTKTETVHESCTELLSVDLVYLTKVLHIITVGKALETHCSSTDNALSKRSTAT